MTTTPKVVPTRSEEVVRKHKEFIWPSVTNYYQHPLVADHASMQYLWDVEGNKYLDFFGGIVTIGVGHCNPKVTEKIKAQVDKLQHTSTLFPERSRGGASGKAGGDYARKIAEEFLYKLGHRSERSGDHAFANGIAELRHCGAAACLFGRVGAGEVGDGAIGMAQGRSDQRGDFACGESLLLSLPAAPDLSIVQRGVRE